MPQETDNIVGELETLFKLNLTVSIPKALSQIQIDQLKVWFESYLNYWPQPDCSVVLIADNMQCTVHQLNNFKSQ